MSFNGKIIDITKNFLFGKEQKSARNIIFLLLGGIYGFIFNYYLKEIYTIAKKIATNGDFYISYLNGIFAFLFTIAIISIFKVYIVSFIKKIYNSFFNIISIGTNKDDYFLDKFAFRLVTLTQLYLATKICFHLIKKGIIKGFYVDEITTIILMILWVIYIIYFISGSLRIFLERQFQVSLEKNSENASVLRFMNRIIYIIIWIIGFAYILHFFGYNPMTLLAGAGIGGIAIAFGAQKSIANIFGAITILLNKPFQIGDFIQIGNIEGSVRDIGLTYIRILDREGRQVMVPNETIITTEIRNFSQREKRLVSFILGLDFRTSRENIEKAVEKIENLLESYFKKGKITNDIRVHFCSFGTYTLNIEVKYFSIINILSEHIKIKQEINLEIKNILDELKITLSFPVQEIILRNGNEKNIFFVDETKK